jgi:hypothetical protein
MVLPQAPQTFVVEDDHGTPRDAGSARGNCEMILASGFTAAVPEQEMMGRLRTRPSPRKRQRRPADASWHCARDSVHPTTRGTRTDVEGVAAGADAVIANARQPITMAKGLIGQTTNGTQSRHKPTPLAQRSTDRPDNDLSQTDVEVDQSVSGRAGRARGAARYGSPRPVPGPATTSVQETPE